MNKRNIHLLYGFVFIATVCLFAVYLFPRDKIRTHIMITFHKAFPDYQLDIGNLEPALPAALKLDDVSVSYRNEEAVNATDVTIGYKLLSLFRSGTGLFFKGHAYGGALKGNTDIGENESNRQVAANVDFSSMRIEDIPMIQNNIDFEFSGFLGGTIVYDTASDKEQVVATLHLTECVIPLIIPFLNLEELNFKDIEIDVTLSKKNISISRCILKENRMDGQLTGTVTVNDPIFRSVLNLTGTMKPHHEFLQTLPTNLIPGKRFKKNGLPFKVSGTLEKPNFSFN